MSVGFGAGFGVRQPLGALECVPTNPRGLLGCLPLLERKLRGSRALACPVPAGFLAPGTMAGAQWVLGAHLSRRTVGAQGTFSSRCKSALTWLPRGCPLVPAATSLQEMGLRPPA